MVGHVTYLSEYGMAHKFGRKRQKSGDSSKDEAALFSVESYLHHQGQSFVKRFDPNSYLYLTKAFDQFDLFENGSPAEVLPAAWALDRNWHLRARRKLANLACVASASGARRAWRLDEVRGESRRIPEASRSRRP